MGEHTWRIPEKSATVVPEFGFGERPARTRLMKMLHLLRHAKSSAKDDVEDHERPLSRRGRATARQIGLARLSTWSSQSSLPTRGS